MYATGIRGRTSLAAVTATIGGTNAEVLYADVQPESTGLDQVNILIPGTLAGRRVIDLVLIVDGIPANTVQLNIR